MQIVTLINLEPLLVPKHIICMKYANQFNANIISFTACDNKDNKIEIGQSKYLQKWEI